MPDEHVDAQQPSEPSSTPQPIATPPMHPELVAALDMARQQSASADSLLSEVRAVLEGLRSSSQEQSKKKDEAAQVLAELAARATHAERVVAQLNDIKAKAEAFQATAERASSTATVVGEAFQQRNAEISQLLGQAQANAKQISDAAANVGALEQAAKAQLSQVTGLGQEVKAGAETFKSQVAEAEAAITQTRSNAASNLNTITEAVQTANTLTAETRTHNAELASILGEAKVIQGQLPAILSAMQDGQQKSESALTAINTAMEAAQKATQESRASAASAAAADKSAAAITNRLGPLEEDINAARNALQELHQSGDELLIKIESLLPGATSAGLASSFKDQKDTFERPKRFNYWLFMASVVGLGATTLIPIHDPLMDKLSNPWQLVILEVLHKSPFLVPLSLVAWFSNRSYRAIEKIEQDYAYKERIATAFEGFKKAFAEIPSTNGTEPALSLLCKEVIGLIGRHPARFFDKRHEEDPPGALQLATKLEGAITGRDKS